MKNGRLTVILLVLLAAMVALSAATFRAEAPVRFGVAAGPGSWWACALPGFAGSDYTVTVYPDETKLLDALQGGTLDAAEVTADVFSALSAEEYAPVAVTRRATLTLVQPADASAALHDQAVLVPESLRGLAEAALLETAAPGTTLAFAPEEEILAAAAAGTLARAFLPAESAARALRANESLHAALEVCEAYRLATGESAPAAAVIAVRVQAREETPKHLATLLAACESSRGYAQNNAKKAALLCIRYGLDGGFDAAEIAAMIPRMGYERNESD